MKRKLFKIQFTEDGGDINVVIETQAKLGRKQLLLLLKMGIHEMIQTAESIGGKEAIEFMTDESPADLSEKA